MAKPGKCQNHHRDTEGTELQRGIFNSWIPAGTAIDSGSRRSFRTCPLKKKLCDFSVSLLLCGSSSRAAPMGPAAPAGESGVVLDHLGALDLAQDLSAAGEYDLHLAPGVTDDDVALDHRTA